MKHPAPFTALLCAVIALLPNTVSAENRPPASAPVPNPTTQTADDPVIARIEQEGLKDSHVDQTLDYLCNVIGPRLTGSPGQRRASEWTCQTLAGWGLSNAHLEPWGPFGRGWALEQYSLQVVEPYVFIPASVPKAWSPGFDAPVTGEAIYLDAKTKSDLAKYAGKLKGKFVLIGQVRPLDAHFEPESTRMTDQELAKLASAPPPRARAEMLASTGPLSTAPASASPPPAASAPASQPVGNRPSPLAQTGALAFASEELAFAEHENAAAVLDASLKGDGGTVFVAAASVPRASTQPASTAPSTGPSATPSAPTPRPRAWAADAPAMPVQVTLSAEDFNRLVSILRNQQKVSLAMNLKVHYLPPAEVHTANTVAEIPGSDLKDQVVMVGGHLDSWHGGTGATDNGAGAACAMEAVRILRALDLHPRRTIRVVLWTGEEQGLLGSAAYAKQHFGSLPDTPNTAPVPRSVTRPVTQPDAEPLAQLVKTKEYDRLSVYFNLDNGSGKIRGVFAQGDAAAVPYFHQWLAPFAKLGASTVTLANTTSTDHISFDRIGLPGFQFIQDPLEYGTRTHHSTADVYDRLQMDDLKQASTIMAAFLWDAANMGPRFPRKQ
jgi:hypothetical protein